MYFFYHYIIMAKFPKVELSKLCTPAFIYFVISMIGLIALVIGNLGNTTKFNLGLFSVYVPNVLFVFIVQFIYILFWTWVLNLICKDGHSGISWFLVLLPFILYFLLLAVVGTKEGVTMMKKMKKVKK